MSGELADDVTWTRLLQNTELTTLDAAIRSLPDVQFLLQLTEDKRNNEERPRLR